MKDRLIQFIFTFFLALIVGAATTYAWNLWQHDVARADWPTSVVLATVIAAGRTAEEMRRSNDSQPKGRGSS